MSFKLSSRLSFYYRLPAEEKCLDKSLFYLQNGGNLTVTTMANQDDSNNLFQEHMEQPDNYTFSPTNDDVYQKMNGKVCTRVFGRMQSQY